jgi:hypothetical protein
MTPQAPGNQGDERIECLLMQLGNPFTRLKPPIYKSVVRCRGDLTPAATPEELEPGFPTEDAADQEVIEGLIHLIAEVTWHIVG